MNIRFRMAAGAPLLMLLLAVSGAAPAAPTTAPLTACVIDGNEPFSSRSEGAKGLDIDVMEAVSSRMGRTLQLNWIVVPARGGMGRALKQSIQAGQCDLFVGLPETEGGGEELSERGLIASRTYVSVGYALVVPAASKVRSMADLHKARVGAVTATPADLYLLAGNFDRRPYGNARQLLDAVAGGQLAGALIWSGRLAESPLPDGLAVREVLHDATLTTRFHIASRRADAALGSELDQALEALASDGTLDTLARKAGFP